MTFGVVNYGVIVEHTEKARPFANIRRTKIVHGSSRFVKCACTLHMKFAQHKKKIICEQFASNNAMMPFGNGAGLLYLEQPNV